MMLQVRPKPYIPKSLQIPFWSPLRNPVRSKQMLTPHLTSYTPLCCQPISHGERRHPLRHSLLGRTVGCAQSIRSVCWQSASTQLKCTSVQPSSSSSRASRRPGARHCSSSSGRGGRHSTSSLTKYRFAMPRLSTRRNVQPQTVTRELGARVHRLWS